MGRLSVPAVLVPPSWRLAFDELYGIAADIGKFTDAGMTDPEVGRRTFVAVIGHPPSRKEFSRLMERRLHYLYGTVADSKSYRVLAGVDKLLPWLIEHGYLLGLVTGNVEAAAHIKLHRARLNRFFSFSGYGSDANDRAELTRLALERAALVYGEPIDPKRCLTVGDTPLDVTARPCRGNRVRWGGERPLQRRAVARGGRRFCGWLAQGRPADLMPQRRVPI